MDTSQVNHINANQDNTEVEDYVKKLCGHSSKGYFEDKERNSLFVIIESSKEERPHRQRGKKHL